MKYFNIIPGSAFLLSICGVILMFANLRSAERRYETAMKGWKASDEALVRLTKETEKLIEANNRLVEATKAMKEEK